MPTVEIINDEKNCRGCSMCVDECPVKVFDRVNNPKTGHKMAKVSRSDDCMGCFSCYYLCPSQCIKISDVDMQRPFYRIDENISLVKRFLGVDTTSKDLVEADWEEAYKDVSMTLVSLSKAIKFNMGRGIRKLGDRAGKLAASHIPEVFEERELADRLKRLQQRFRHSFDFEFEIQDGNINFTFAPCSLFRIVENETTEKPGNALLCQLFHDFWAGLIGAYSGVNYRHVAIPCSRKEVCVVFLSPK
ncbi:methyl viologen-reducing hydrogenase-associated ferredoxin [Candidatus Thiomargarita nelsonii]|uniref:Methyl viologen-reducing hydrogenase-associated ferredoxin n=1 Tax=Candidatus Thiomargarita nelsonii TaxID=1003181 RepID=A0A176RW97_9GAMM|nr:methyl viologen-reducing hydrogenase-associated ferredoxin [Candidatus Thiomargarita nelsonii]